MDLNIEQKTALSPRGDNGNPLLDENPLLRTTQLPPLNYFWARIFLPLNLIQFLFEGI